MNDSAIVWRPGPELISSSNLGRWMRELGIDNYQDFHAFSVRERPDFWSGVFDRLGVKLRRAPESMLDVSGGAEQARWLPGARLNCVESCFQADPESPAIWFASETQPEPNPVSLEELKILANRVSNGLVARDFQPGDAIALYMPMTVECVAAYLGIVQAGMRVVSIADSFSPRELARRLKIGDAKAVLTVERFRRGEKEIVLYDKVKEAGAPMAIVVGTGGALRGGDVVWDDFLGDNGEFTVLAARPDDVINILFSSGTTGDPKAIPWTQLTPFKAAMDGHFHQDIRPGDVVAWPTNIGWMMGPWLIFAALVNRASIALFEGLPTGPGFIDFVGNAKVNVLGLVPSLVRTWRANDLLPENAWPSLRVMTSTGEASSADDYLWLSRRTAENVPVIEYCGGTELGGGYIGGTIVQPWRPSTFTTPALGLDFVILDERGKPVSEGEMGEVFLIPPSIGMSQRLLNRDHHEAYYAGCPAGPGGEVLRRHGDQLRRLTGGYFKAEGRADDTMNLGGIKVGSIELETVIDSRDAIYQSAAVAVPEPGGGVDRLVLFVVLNACPAPEHLREELQELIASELNPLFKIHDIVIVDSLPRTASNKIMRRELRARYEK